MFKKISVALIFLGVASQAYANTAQMNQNLLTMVGTLNQLMPLIQQAEKEQDPNAPVQFHFENWHDTAGHKHSGLKSDILKIRQALIEQIKQNNLAPTVIKPIKGDYLGSA